MNFTRRSDRAISFGVFWRSAPFDELDHAVDERFPRLGRDLNPDPIGEHFGAAGHRRPVSSRFPDHGRRFPGDRRLVHGGDALDDVAVTRDHLAGRHHHEVADLQVRGGDRFLAAIAHQSPRHQVGPGPAEALRLGLPPSFRHRLREVGEQDREPQTERDRRVERDRPAAPDVCREPDGDHDRHHLDDEDHGIAEEGSRVQLLQAVEGGSPDDGWIEQRPGTRGPRPLGRRLRGRHTASRGSGVPRWAPAPCRGGTSAPRSPPRRR